MNKKFISVIMAAMLAVSAVAVSAGAAEVEEEKAGAEVAVQGSSETGKIKFNSGDWHSTKMLFYIWDANGKHATKTGWGDADPWGSPKKLGGTAVEGEDGVFESFEVELNWDTDYFVIFHDPDHGQTFDCCLDPSCFGETAYMTGNMIENPEDSEKTCIEAVFPNGLGPALTITSSGNIVGSYVSPHVDRADKVAKWIVKYLGKKEKLSGADIVTEDTVARAIEAFETNADDVWAAYQNHEGEDNYNAEEAKKFIKPTSSDNGNGDGGNGDSTDSSGSSDGDTNTDSSSSGSSGSSGSSSGSSSSSKSSSSGSTAASGSTDRKSVV